MSAGNVPPILEGASLRRGRFTYFPVVPGRMEFALEVRRAILRDRPRVIALELPASLEAAWMGGIARLPAMSLIFYPADDEQAEYVLVPYADWNLLKFPDRDQALEKIKEATSGR